MAQVEGRPVFESGIWFWSQKECGEFAEEQVTKQQFQWFIKIVSYLQFVIGGTVSTAEFQWDKVHAAKVRNTK